MAINDAFTLTDSDLDGLLDLINGTPGGEEEEAPVGVRDLSGLGNNLDNPTFGTADQPFIRLTTARYGAAEGTTNLAINPIFAGLDPRNISNILGSQETDLGKAASGSNIFLMAFGQYFDHGLDFVAKGGSGAPISIGGGLDNPADLTRASVTSWEGGVPQHTNKTSPFVDQNQAYGSHNYVGQFLRASSGINDGLLGATLLSGGPDPSSPAFNLLPTLRDLILHHWNAETVFQLASGAATLRQLHPTLVDGAGVVDLDVATAFGKDVLGSGQNLLLDTNPYISVLDHYIAGDGRANENIALTAMHTVWARNHNFHVENLVTAGFVGSAEELFQAAKMINEAEYQRVVFAEYADAMIGGIQGDGDHGFNEYNPEVDARISHEFAAAVFRVGHSQIGDQLTVLDAAGNPTQVNLVDAFLNPTNATLVGNPYLPAGFVPQPGYAQHGAGNILAGIATQPSEEVDFNIVDAVRNDLVRIRADLFAFNVARGWDVGLGTLNQVRADLAASSDSYIAEAVGYAGDLTPYTSWEDFQTRNNLSVAVIEQFKEAYPDLRLDTAAQLQAFKDANGDAIIRTDADGAYVHGIDRVDLWVGGLAESHINGGQVGQTFWVVLHEQFDRLQEGDRLYYIDRFDGFDFYADEFENTTFADIVARNTGLTGLPENIFSVLSDDDGDDQGDGGGDGGAGQGNGDDPGDDQGDGVNAAPEATGQFVYATEDAVLDVSEDMGLFFDAFDPDDDTLSVATINGADIVFSDGIAIFELDSGALLTVNADGSYSYDPHGAFDALVDGDAEYDSFTFELWDGGSLSNEELVEVEIAGVGASDGTGGGEDEDDDEDEDDEDDEDDNGGDEDDIAVSITSGDGEPVTVGLAENTTADAAGVIYDVDAISREDDGDDDNDDDIDDDDNDDDNDDNDNEGAAIVYSIVEGNDDQLFAIDPSTGVITLIGTAPDFESPGGPPSYTLIVRAENEDGYDEQEITVRITDVNEAPVVVVVNPAPLTESDAASPVTINLMTQTQITDPDANDEQSLVPDTAVVVDDNGHEHELLTIDADNGIVSFDRNDFNYLAAGESAIYTIMYSVQSGPDTIEDLKVVITITGENDGPAAVTAIPDQSSAEDAEWTFEVPAETFSDADLIDTLELSATLANGNPLPDWLLFDVATATFSGTPPENYSGSIVVTVTATDAEDSSASTSFKLDITPVNDPPIVVTPIADQSSAEDAVWSFVVPAGTFSDVDDATLAMGATLADGNPLPAWLSFNPGTRTFTGTPPLNFDGDISLKVTATDSGNASVSSTFTLDIAPVNDAPVAAEEVESGAGDEDTEITGTLLAGTDVDGNALTFSLVPNSAMHGTVTINPQTGAYTFTPDDNYFGPAAFKYVVNDDKVDSAPKTVSITVKPVNDAPINLRTSSGAATTFSVMENAAGAVLGGLAFDDVDLGDRHTFTVSDDRFEVDATTHQLRLKTDKSLDFEAGRSVDLTVTVEDLAGLSTSKTFAIDVENVTETTPTGGGDGTTGTGGSGTGTGGSGTGSTGGGTTPGSTDTGTGGAAPGAGTAGAAGATAGASGASGSGAGTGGASNSSSGGSGSSSPAACDDNASAVACTTASNDIGLGNSFSSSEFGVSTDSVVGDSWGGDGGWGADNYGGLTDASTDNWGGDGGLGVDSYGGGLSDTSTDNWGGDGGWGADSYGGGFSDVSTDNWGGDGGWGDNSYGGGFSDTSTDSWGGGSYGDGGWGSDSYGGGYSDTSTDSWGGGSYGDGGWGSDSYGGGFSDTSTDSGGWGGGYSDGGWGGGDSFGGGGFGSDSGFGGSDW